VFYKAAIRNAICNGTKLGTKIKDHFYTTVYITADGTGFLKIHGIVFA
jgi:hypothetical protein